MGLSIVLETERGEPLDRVDNTKNLLHELLPLHDDLSYQLLRFVDWYADTTFRTSCICGTPLLLTDRLVDKP